MKHKSLVLLASALVLNLSAIPFSVSVFADSPVSLLQEQPKNAADLRDPQRGVTSDFIERRTFMTITRLSAMPNGGVQVTYSADFQPDEVLAIDANNKPMLMQLGANGELSPYPNRRAAVHKNDIMLIDNAVNLASLKDEPFPAASFNESDATRIGVGQERNITPQPGTPITAADFDRPLPTAQAYSVGTAVSPTGERTVSMPVAGTVAPGWRLVTVGDSMLVLDSRGVIQNILPANASVLP